MWHGASGRIYTPPFRRHRDQCTTRVQLASKVNKYNGGSRIICAAELEVTIRIVFLHITTSRTLHGREVIIFRIQAIGSILFIHFKPHLLCVDAE